MGILLKDGRAYIGQVTGKDIKADVQSLEDYGAKISKSQAELIFDQVK